MKVLFDLFPVIVFFGVYKFLGHGNDNCLVGTTAHQLPWTQEPILMATAAAIMGTLPIAIGFGADADARRPLGLCVVGGLVFAQVVTLYLTPVFYTYMDRVMKGRHRFPIAAAHGQPRAPP